jgi:hypothetical protein
LVECMAVRNYFRNRGWRTATTFALVFLQVHLFLLIVFHHHNSDYLVNQTPVVGQRHHTPIAVDTNLICTTCQIIRHSPLRPTLGPPPPQVDFVAPFHLAIVRDDLPSFQKIAVFGRAPPLA